MRIVFMGTPVFALPSLRCLVERGHQVLSVYTQPDKAAGRGRSLGYSPVKKLALDMGLPVAQPESLKPAEEIVRLSRLSPEAIVVAAFGQLLRPEVLQIPRYGCLNVHPSLLPRHRGASPVAAAILAVDEVTGVTVMLLDKGLDTGPILAQVTQAISPDDTTGSLTAKLAEVGANLLVDTLPRWASSEIKPQAQDEAKATYSRPLTKEAGEIDWQLPAVELWRRVRAFQPWPGCYTWWRGKQLKITEAVALPDVLGVGVGVVVALEGMPGVGVKTGQGVLGLRWLQLEGKKAMLAEEFIRGQREFVGGQLGR